MGEVLLSILPPNCSGRLYRQNRLGGQPRSEYIAVVAEPVTDITEVFEELSLGEPIWNEDGTMNDEGGR